MAELTELQKQLFELQDIKYRDFHSKLMPETAKEKIIGIRIPVLRKFAKVFADTPESEPFLQQLPILPLPLFSYYPVCLLHNALHGVENVFIPRASAQVAGYQLAQLIAVIPLSGTYDLHRCHDQSRRTETALNCRLLYKCLLDSAQLAVWPL